MYMTIQLELSVNEAETIKTLNAEAARFIETLFDHQLVFNYNDCDEYVQTAEGTVRLVQKKSHDARQFASIEIHLKEEVSIEIWSKITALLTWAQTFPKHIIQ